MRHADSTATLTNLLLLISAILILVSVASDVRSDWGAERDRNEPTPPGDAVNSEARRGEQWVPRYGISQALANQSSSAQPIMLTTPFARSAAIQDQARY